jgi:hypothetical protein
MMARTEQPRESARIVPPNSRLARLLVRREGATLRGMGDSIALRFPGAIGGDPAKVETAAVS